MTQLASVLAPSAVRVPRVTAVDDALDACRRHLGMPIAYLTVFDGDDVVFRSVLSDDASCGVKVGDRQPAAGGYCKAVRDGDLPQIMPDTSLHPVARSLPMTGMVPIGAMIAIPLVMGDGSTYGMFCCVSHAPMPALNDRDHAVMTSFARLAADVIGSDLAAARDSQTDRQRVADVIADRDFQLLLQPIVALGDNSVMGAEALCRFRPTPYRSPDKWFALAAQAGLQRQLETAVITKTLALLPDLPRALKLSINVSPEMLASGTLPGLIDGPFCERIVFELTEHENLADLTALQQQMKQLRRLGVQIAVDDLGAAYGSLNTVLQIKPDIVKLDRELVRGINLDPASRALAAGVVHFAQAIGADIIAEGIEKIEEARTLHALGVTFGQGFMLGRPGSMTALQARTFIC